MLFAYIYRDVNGSQKCRVSVSRPRQCAVILGPELVV